MNSDEMKKESVPVTLPQISFIIDGSNFVSTFEDVMCLIKKIREAYDDGTCILRILVNTPFRSKTQDN